MLDPVAGLARHHRLGMKGDARARGQQHGQIIGAIPYRHRIGQGQFPFIGQRAKCLKLGFRTDHRFDNPAGQPAIGPVQPVAAMAVKADPGRHHLGENVEAARHQRRDRAMGGHGPHQLGPTGGQSGIVQHGPDVMVGGIAQQGHAFAQGFPEIQFAVHGTLGNAGHRLANSRKDGYFIKGLVGDDGRIHIGHQHLLAALAVGLDDDINGPALHRQPCGREGILPGGAVKRQFAGNIRTKPAGRPDIRAQGIEPLAHRVDEALVQFRHRRTGNQGQDMFHEMINKALLQAYKGRQTARQGIEEEMTTPIHRRPPVIVVAGPTASGKSALALDLAKTFTGTVINADSMQVYKELRIVTARPSADDEARAPHRLYGVVSAQENFSVGRWLQAALAEIQDTLATGRVPIVTGGTGLYLKCLMEGLSPLPAIDPDQRAAMRDGWRTIATEELHRQLHAQDPDSAARLSAADRQRITRALEIVLATGRPMSAWINENPPVPPIQAQFLPLLVMPPREILYRRCDRRFVSMLEDGALEEVQALADLDLPPHLPAMKALGVPSLLAHLAGRVNLEDATAQATQQTRRFAKRQCTWFRNQMKPALVMDAQYSERERATIFSFVRQFLLTPRNEASSVPG